MLNVLNRLVIPIHANISQKTDIVQQIVEFTLKFIKKFSQSARILTTKNYFYHFASIFVIAFFDDLLDFRGTILNFKFECVIDSINIMLVVLVIEEMHENLLLILFHDDIFSSDES